MTLSIQAIYGRVKPTFGTIRTTPAVTAATPGVHDGAEALLALAHDTVVIAKQEEAKQKLPELPPDHPLSRQVACFVENSTLPSAKDAHVQEHYADVQANILKGETAFMQVSTLYTLVDTKGPGAAVAQTVAARTVAKLIAAADEHDGRFNGVLLELSKKPTAVQHHAAHSMQFITDQKVRKQAIQNLLHPWEQDPKGEWHPVRLTHQGKDLGRNEYQDQMLLSKVAEIAHHVSPLPLERMVFRNTLRRESRGHYLARIALDQVPGAIFKEPPHYGPGISIKKAQLDAGAKVRALQEADAKHPAEKKN